ncbi:Methyltransferase domain-containing protein [Thermanaeromonas toyohensis ToBE]|uniref:Methyltransferase domain-containing protein n=1 Tax=Thermanaeromonas toyohensis ToBE TaxID=698762 RepID=A0A1W1VT72_9FIRM|nr:class I SAM-dependent methyltransferase [Thermanaeromonas toyohensis]SMB96526.1 Methyltransferase domain-containing protein [Thermanaeromonas toyohensis ToBE]
MAGLISRHMPSGSQILDVGCGDGWLAEELPQYCWKGVELDPVLLRRALAKGIAVVAGRAEELPFANGSFDGVCLLDVLEHLVDDRKAVEEAWRVLKWGGLLFVSVPLHPALWSAHDEMCGHFRRYRKKELRRMLGECGFRVVAEKYFVSLLQPAVWVIRKLGCSGSARLPGILDRLAEIVLLADAALGLPFGLTEVIVVSKYP